MYSRAGFFPPCMSPCAHLTECSIFCRSGTFLRLGKQRHIHDFLDICKYRIDIYMQPIIWIRPSLHHPPIAWNPKSTLLSGAFERLIEKSSTIEEASKEIVLSFTLGTNADPLRTLTKPM